MAGPGKTVKSDAAKYKNKKKLYFVRNLYLPQNSTDKYREIFYRYWSEVQEHLDKLEAAGRISKIFCESIYMTGEESMKVLSTMNVRLEQIVKKMTDAGGEFLPLEGREIFGSYVDWNNCLMLVRTPEVYETVYKHFKETVSERFKYINSVLRKNIAKGEAGLLIMREEDREFLELPDDFELFLVTPPAYDELLQFISDRDSGKEFWRS
ncbi:MAG TPA: hypothetical protein ENH82_02755 [bacterium]|nr:hypothetical protein [bacterium]